MQVGRPEGDYSHQAVVIYYGANLVVRQSQRQNLVALSSAEAEFIASVWGNCLALSLYGQFNEMILEKPTYVTYCYNVLGGPNGLLPLAHQNRAVTESFGKSEIPGPKHFCDFSRKLPRHGNSDHLMSFK